MAQGKEDNAIHDLLEEMKSKKKGFWRKRDDPDKEEERKEKEVQKVKSQRKSKLNEQWTELKQRKKEDDTNEEAAAVEKAGKKDVKKLDAKEKRQLAKEKKIQRVKKQEAEEQVKAEERKKLKQEKRKLRNDKRQKAVDKAVPAQEVNNSDIEEEPEPAERKRSAPEKEPEQESQPAYLPPPPKKSKKSKDRTQTKSEDREPEPAPRGADQAGPVGTSGQDAGPPKPNPCRIYCGGLPFSMPEADVRGLFAECGPITDMFCMTFPDSGRFRGIALITFEDKESADRALAYNDTEYEGQWLKIKLAVDRPAEKPKPSGGKAKVPGSTTAYVGNLSWDVDEDTLRNLFEGCEIEHIRFATDKETGEFKGFGHVQFNDDESLERAVALNGTDLLGRPVRVGYSENLQKKFKAREQQSAVPDA